MTGMADKAKVITLKNEGLSNREVSRRTGLNRETVSKYWEEYKRLKHKLMQGNESCKVMDEKQVQEELLKAPKYTVNGRVKRKYTEEMEERLKEILKGEKRKDSILGVGHKQSMTNRDRKIPAAQLHRAVFA